MSKQTFRTICIVMAVIAVLALAMACVVCGGHAAHDAHCHCALCLALRCVVACLPLLAALGATRTPVRINMERTHDAHESDTPVLLAVKLNC